MTQSMFRALNELKSDSAVLNKVLERASKVNYSKSTHRNNILHMQYMFLLLLLYKNHLVAGQYSQLYAKAKYLIQQSQSQLTKCMPITIL